MQKADRLSLERIIFFTIMMIFLLPKLYADSKEEKLSRRLQAHLTLKDYGEAIEEAEQALFLFPDSKGLHEGYIRALAKSGDEKKLLQAWESYIKKFPNQSLNRELIEEIAWGVLAKASHSSSIIMREMALLAAFFAQDAKGVNILHQGVQDSNYAVRSIAVKLAAHFRDEKLIADIKRLFQEEKVWSVRKAVLEAIGKMKIVSMVGDLEALIASEESLASEKALAISSLLELLDHVNRSEVDRLSSSNRAGLRQLACQAIAYFQSVCDVGQLFILAKDINPEVRLQAYQAMGQLRPLQQRDQIYNCSSHGVNDFNYQVAISAAWLLTIYSPEEGQRIFSRFLHDSRADVRSLAAAALVATGEYGSELAKKEFFSHSDPYVRLNLAIGLLRQRIAVQESGAYLREMLIAEKEKWNYFDVGLFSAICNKPQNKTSDDLFSSPEIENQLIRLEILNLLSILKIPDTQQAIRSYLLERSWEISATASALLLTEGDDAAIEMVQNLLHDPLPRVRLQAAFILSLWSHEESAIQTLQEGYKGSDWESKTKILEGLGRIGSIHSVPFLIQVLKEPSQTLRLIAAMALIECLNH